MSTASSAISIIVGGAVGASLGQAVTRTKASLGELRDNTARASADMASRMAKINKRQNDVRKLMALRANKGGISAELDAARSKAQALHKRLQQLKMYPALKDDARRAAQELKQTDRAVATLNTRLQRNKEAQEDMRRKLDQNRDAYRQNRLEIGKLTREMENYQRIGQGVEQTKSALKVGAAITATATPMVMKSADYQAIIRAMAIKGGFANTAQEREMSAGIMKSSQENGIGVTDLSQAIDRLVSSGMDAKEAFSYADLIGKFSVGQGVSPEDTAAMIAALSQNALIKDREGMKQAMESIAYQGQEGNFEAENMARAFPSLLAQMQNIGITGQDAVRQLGSMLQVQMRVSGSPEEAQTNLKNWITKIGAGETIRHYADAGIDYEAQMKEAIGKGWSSLEASLELARAYVDQVEPGKAEEIRKFASAIDQISDPDKRQQQISAFEDAMKTGDIFRDQQVKMALTAYMQNSEFYRKLVRESATANGLLDKNQEEAREASANKWREAGQAFDRVLIHLGDAIRPVTDGVASFVTELGNLANSLMQINPEITKGVGSVVATGAIAYGGYKLTKGVGNIARGAWGIFRNGGLSGMSQAGQVASSTGLFSRLASGGRNLLSRVPGLSRLGQVAGRGRLGQALGVVSAATATPVFITNWPMGGLGGGIGGGGKKGGVGQAIGKSRSILGRATAAALAFGKSALSFKGAALVGSAALGYTAGKYVVNPLLNKAVSSLTGRENSLGTWLAGDGSNIDINEKTPEILAAMERKKQREAAAAESGISLIDPKAERNVVRTGKLDMHAAASAQEKEQTKPAQITFAPNVNVTVNGDVKDPRKLAEELLPHMRRLLDQFSEKAARGDLFDPAHA